MCDLSPRHRFVACTDPRLVSVRFSRVYAKLRAGGEKREERERHAPRRAYSARCTPRRRYASRATRQDKRFYYEKSGGETKSRAARVRPAAIIPSGGRGKYPRCREGRGGDDGKGRLEIGVDGEPPWSSRTVRSTIRSNQPIPTPSLPYTPLPAPLVARESSRSVLSVTLRVSLTPSHLAGVRGWLGCCRKGGGVRRQSLRERWAWDFCRPRDLFFRSLLLIVLVIGLFLSLAFPHSAFRWSGSRDPLDARDLITFFSVTSKEVHLDVQEGDCFRVCSTKNWEWSESRQCVEGCRSCVFWCEESRGILENS